MSTNSQIDKHMFYTLNSLLSQQNRDGVFDLAYIREKFNNSIINNCNFTNYKGSIICYIAGHWHRDLTENISLNGVPIILITSAKDDRDTSLSPRTDGTDQETAFDVVVVNRQTRKIHCIRCGAGEDRTITY